jgi:hypothetical protein
MAKMSPKKGNMEASLIFVRVASPVPNKLITGPRTNPIPNAAVILPKYFGRSASDVTSDTQLCITGSKPPNIPTHSVRYHKLTPDETT